MHEILLTGALSTQQFNSSMVTSFTAVPRNILKLPEAVTIHKQEQFTQVY